MEKEKIRVNTVVVDQNRRCQYKFVNFNECRPTETRIDASVGSSVVSLCSLTSWQQQHPRADEHSQHADLGC